MIITVLAGLLVLVIGGTSPYMPSLGMKGTAAGDYETGTVQLWGQEGGHSAAATKRSAAGRPRGPYIVIDRYCNKLYLRTADSVILEAPCSTGSEGELIDTVSGRTWKFGTPSGVFAVDSKLVNPWWKKPDWAFIEEGEPVPKNESDRFDDEMMGDYAIGFGQGYFIHGTIYERLLGAAVTHGCVRLGAKDLKKLYDNTRIGTRIYVF